ncbi:hypothetical protein AGMMS49579_09200 [Spirochaetia bacterium]|nr:hypothetical protein AGMMS49579_09200 [Spirochaetia bacterium]
MQCPKCSAKIESDWKYCKKCGLALSSKHDDRIVAETKILEVQIVSEPTVEIIDNADIQLEYNPLSETTTLLCNEKIVELPCIGTGKNIRLNEYIHDFFIDLQNRLRLGKGSVRTMSFHGTAGDFEQVSIAFNKYNERKAEHGVELTLNFIEKEYR